MCLEILINPVFIQKVSIPVCLYLSSLFLACLMSCIKWFFDAFSARVHECLTLDAPPGSVDHSHTKDWSWETNKCLLLLYICYTPGLCCVWKKLHCLAGFGLHPSECFTSPLLNLEAIGFSVWFCLKWIWKILSLYTSFCNPWKNLEVFNALFWQSAPH